MFIPKSRVDNCRTVKGYSKLLLKVFNPIIQVIQVQSVSVNCICFVLALFSKHMHTTYLQFLLTKVKTTAETNILLLRTMTP